MASQDEIRIKKIEVARLKLMGYSLDQIVSKTGIPKRTVSRYLADWEDDWRVSYSEIYDQVKIHKMAELANVKRLAHEAIAACQKQEDYPTISRFLTNILSAIDKEINIWGLAKNNSTPEVNPETAKFLQQLIDGGMSEIDVQDFITWQTEKYQRENS